MEAPIRSSPYRTILSVILVAAILAASANLYYVPAPIQRLGVGLILLALIIWVSGRLGVVELVLRSVTGRRRFVRLRRVVMYLLEEVRRLNWIAVDVDRGFRSREAASQEMDAIENRLTELIHEIRGAAGKLETESARPGIALAEENEEELVS